EADGDLLAVDRRGAGRERRAADLDLGVRHADVVDRRGTGGAAAGRGAARAAARAGDAPPGPRPTAAARAGRRDVVAALGGVDLEVVERNARRRGAVAVVTLRPRRLLDA